jgi:hypothetical protein
MNLTSYKTDSLEIYINDLGDIYCDLINLSIICQGKFVKSDNLYVETSLRTKTNFLYSEAQIFSFLVAYNRKLLRDIFLNNVNLRKFLYDLVNYSS